MQKRIQRSRAKGWRMPENAVYVGRPSRWGNDNKIGDPYPFIEDHLCTLDDVLWLYDVDLQTMEATGTIDDFLAPLRGKDLACWCPLDQACHADVLIRWLTKRALDGGDSAASQAVSTPEVLSTLQGESTPARRK